MSRPSSFARILAVSVLTFAVGMAAEAQSERAQSLRQIVGRAHNQSGSEQAKPAGIGSNPFMLIDYPGGLGNQYPSAINDKGKIVGVTGLPDGSFQGYLLQGSTFRLISYPNAPNTAAFGINKSGVIVGTYCEDAGCNIGHGFMLKGKNFTTLDYPGGTNAEALAINASGDVVGTYESPDSHLHCFLLHKGVYTTFDYPNAYQTVARSINQQGMIVGGYINPDGTGAGFTLLNGTFTEIDYPGVLNSEIDSINDSGDMVGTFQNPGEDGAHGYLLSGGVFTSFDVPFPGSTATAPDGMNNKHQIVGSYGTFSPDDYFFGFLTTY
ncbi:MAG TPA: hypothetical protein VMT67_04980 [Terriglobales bacterium]|nr:hypothetical protein [Terriglobales bacterium]